ncbi:replication protein A 70 kDa DNA-binding subunit B [Tanacetum coccineum]
MFIIGTFTVANIYAPEIYPTTVRATGVGVASSMGRVEGMICPLVAIYLVDGCHQTAAIVLFEIVIILSGLCVMFFPHETMARELADTVSVPDSASIQKLKLTARIIVMFIIQIKSLGTGRVSAKAFCDVNHAGKCFCSSIQERSNIVNMPFPDAQFTMENYNMLIYDELKYNIPDLINQHKALYGSLTLEQKGKTFLYKTLTAALTSKGEIVLNVASSGIDALLLDGGRTTHSRFAIPINIVKDSLCTISADSDIADLIRETKLIIWDEAPMVNRHCFEAFEIRESGYEHEAIMYAKVHKIHRENGWTYIGCKRCGSRAKLIDSSESKSKTSSQSSSKTSGESSSFAAWHNTSKPPKASKQLWWCKRHELIEAVGPKYKVIVRVIDETGSASLLLFDDMIHKLVGVPCYKLKEQYGPNAEDTFPEELTNNIVGKRILFRFTYSEYNISNNNHVYQVKMMCENPEFIKHFKKDFITEDEDDVLETPAPTVGKEVANSVSVNLQVTPPSPKGKEVASSTLVNAGNGDHQSDMSAGFEGSNGNGKRTVIDLDEYDEEAAAANRAKK